ncbi:hypothetical protein VNI00_012652 [Paramarasmius palmivorus]|uniref:Centrosomal protein ATPase n=1 Tax=Paramarasmius palmivorus TaxID=297713 RepID=A0AAW0C3T2_9AGAR
MSTTSRGRNYSESITTLHSAAYQLSTKPEVYPLYNIRLLPLTIERSAYLSQVQLTESYQRSRAQLAYEEEREQVEAEWKRGRERVRERLLEGIEERRRRAREDKEGEGGTVEVGVELQARQHVTRKLRNKIGGSPPPTPLTGSGGAIANPPNGTTLGAISSLPITTGPFLNPHSLSVDEIPSLFPLPLTSTSASTTAANAGSGAGGTTSNNRRRPKGGGAQHSSAIGGLGKSLAALSACKESEIEADLIEIRRGNKKRRAAAQAAGKSTGQQ